MLLSSCCLASSATQDGSQHCDYLCIFKHGTLCFLKGLMYSWEAGWLPSPRPLLQGPSGCQRRTPQTFFKAQIASGCITTPCPPREGQTPKAGRVCEGPRAALLEHQEHPLPSSTDPSPGPRAGLLPKSAGGLMAPVFLQMNSLLLKLLTQRTRACLCGCVCVCAPVHTGERTSEHAHRHI